MGAFVLIIKSQNEIINLKINVILNKYNLPLKFASQNFSKIFKILFSN